MERIQKKAILKDLKKKMVFIVGPRQAGRYFVHHLLPFSAAELYQLHQKPNLDNLIVRSGFPEPYYAESDIEAKRWRQEYINNLITVDVLDFERITNLSAMRTILDLLRHRVGSPISYKSIAEDVAISPMTVKKYIDTLEALYIIFRITPFSKNIARSILKEPKIYFFDTGLVEGGASAKFENLMASSLLKNSYARKDYLAENCKLHYIRTKDKQEVDFAFTKDQTIELLIEVKNSTNELDKNLYSLSTKYNLPAVQVVKELKLERKSGNINILKADYFLEQLYL